MASFTAEPEPTSPAPLRCLVVDDDPLSVQIVSNCIANTPFLTLAASCASAIEATQVLRQQAFDVLFLDVEMPLMSGLDLLRTLPDPPQVVLITGCSTGIGRATAERLARAGHTVYATARRPESIEGLRESGCRTLELDVTSEESMSAAVASVEEAEGAVGVLVNNAGYSQNGAVETVPLDDVRALAHPVLRHRIITNFHAQRERVTPDDIVHRLVKAVAMPRSGM